MHSNTDIYQNINDRFTLQSSIKMYISIIHFRIGKLNKISPMFLNVLVVILITPIYIGTETIVCNEIETLLEYRHLYKYLLGKLIRKC